MGTYAVNMDGVCIKVVLNFMSDLSGIISDMA
jgi:hypothetical protein